MIIKSITIENFRQYKNKNVIEFSTDPEKNVTVILGVNTSKNWQKPIIVRV